MVRIAPVRLAYNPKTLWFDARDLELEPDEDVVVLTARGMEYGTIASKVFEATDEQVAGLRSPLKPVKRVATEEDVERARERYDQSREALPVFKQMAAETVPDMRPVSVEFLFDSDKAVFYFESEDRVDFRELVRKLASHFHVRVDMKQIGVRDEARMVGGYGHCGQELCCRRLGGEFNPVSIRMAKEQDLSLNPQKISGVCGRLMCCLRYEYDAYRDFHARAPKKNAKIKTPDGIAKVVDLDVPREVVSLQIEGEKAVKIPLAEMEPAEEGAKRPSAVGEEAWERAHEDKTTLAMATDNLLTSQLSASDKLADDPTRVRRVGGRKSAEQAGRTARGGRAEGQAPRKPRQRKRAQDRAEAQPAPVHHARRRRSTTLEADGSTKVETAPAQTSASGSAEAASRKPENQGQPQGGQGQRKGGSSSQRNRRRKGGQDSHRSSHEGSQPQKTNGKTRASGPGRNSSNLRAAKHEGESAQAQAQKPRQAAGQGAQGGGHEAAGGASGTHKRRRRTHHAGGASDQQANQGE